MYSSAIFTKGSNSLRSNFTWTGSIGRPHQPLLALENYRHTGLLDGEDRSVEGLSPISLPVEPLLQNYRKNLLIYWKN